MTYTSSVIVITYTVALLCSIVLLKFLAKPLKVILCIILRAIFGCGAIILVNTVSQYTGVCIALNAVTASLCGVLGSGGVVFLIFYNMFL